MANIVLKTFAAGDDGQGTVTPQDDALIYQNAIPMNGIFSGATVTLSETNVLHVAAGFGIIGGRFFEINESDITVELSSSGTLLGRLYIHLELTNADVPISINVATGASLPALVGDPNLNINDGAFDLELATFNVSEVTISDIVNTFPTISKANNQLRRATAYSVNDMVLCQSASDALIFICTTAGTTAVQEPSGYTSVTDGNTVADGTAVFKACSVPDSIYKSRQVSDSDDAYNPTRPYKVGDLCIYNNVLYRCTTACSAGSWATNQSCFTQDTLTNAVNGLNSDLTNNDFAAEVVIANTDNPTTTVYTFGYDGYLTVKSSYGSGNYVYAKLYGANGTTRSIDVDCAANVGGNNTNVVYVKKGMKCAYVSSQGSFSLRFTAII